MNLRVISRCIALALTLAAAACSTTPPERASVLEVMEQGATSRARNCAALNAATFCEQSSRLDTTKKCGCVDKKSLTHGTPFVF